MVLAAFVSTCFGVAGVHAYRLLSQPASRFHQRALRIALMVGSVCALLQPLSGPEAVTVAIARRAHPATMTLSHLQDAARPAGESRAAAYTLIA